MSANLQRLSNEYPAFYEVLPYHVLVEEGHGSPTVTKRFIQTGFDVDVYGLAKKGAPTLPLPADYSLAYTELEKIADTISRDASECSIEVIPFPESSFSESRHDFLPEARLRIRISHRGVDQPAGPPEEHALEQLEKELQGLGIKRQ
jgi:hypothetical protein